MRYLTQKLNTFGTALKSRLRTRPVMGLVGAAIAYNILVPFPTVSEGFANWEAIAQPVRDVVTVTTERPTLPTIEEVPYPQVTRSYTARVTYYESVPSQTSGNPFITASGTHVHFGTVAANCLPFGTRLRLPELYGDQIFIVEDRFNARYGCAPKVDVWLPQSPSNRSFGAPVTTVEILEAWDPAEGR